MEEDINNSIVPKFQIGDSVYFNFNNEIFTGIIQYISPCNYNNTRFLYYGIEEEQTSTLYVIESDYILPDLHPVILLIEMYCEKLNEDLIQVKEYENFSFVMI